MVAQAHTRLDLVHILTTGTTRAESIPRNIGRIDIDFDTVIYKRSNEYRGKRGHTFTLCIIGRDTYQTVYSVFAFEIAIGIIALDLYGSRLDPGLVAFENIGDSRLITMSLAPTQIKTHKHIGPVLTLGSTGTGIDFEYGAQLIFFPTQHIAQFEIFDKSDSTLINLVEFRLGNHFFLDKIIGQSKFLDRLLYFPVSINPKMQIFDLFHLRFGLLPIFPEIGHMSTQLFLFDLNYFRIDVKDTSSTPTCVLLSL